MVMFPARSRSQDCRMRITIRPRTPCPAGRHSRSTSITPFRIDSRRHISRTFSRSARELIGSEAGVSLSHQSDSTWPSLLSCSLTKMPDLPPGWALSSHRSGESIMKLGASLNSRRSSTVLYSASVKIVNAPEHCRKVKRR